MTYLFGVQSKLDSESKVGDKHRQGRQLNTGTNPNRLWSLQQAYDD